MIPKIIHYCWLSDDKMSPFALLCIESWRRFMPDFELKKWDRKAFDIASQPFVYEAFNAKKYAFASDYIRAYALYTDGGVYLDTDVMLKRDISPLFDAEFVSTAEYFEGGECNIQAAFMASSAGHPLLKDVLDYYEGRHFVKPDGSFDEEVSPKIYARVAEKYGFAPKDVNQRLQNDVHIHASKFVAANSRLDNPDAFAVHFCDHSWCNKGFFSDLTKRIRNISRAVRFRFKSLINKQLLLLLALLLNCVVAQAVTWCDSLFVNAHFTVSGSTNKELNPLWLYSNQWGRYTQYDQCEGTLGFDFRTRLLNASSGKINVELGVGADANSDISESYIHNAYLSANLYMFTFDVGMRPYTPVAIDDEMTTGSWLFSSNARPQPRVGLGIYDWWSIPYTRDWLQIRGACYVGRLWNEDNEKFTQDVFTHDKCAYGRLGGWIAKPYLGMVHSALMGGVRNGSEIPIDFIATILAKNSDKFAGTYRGEATNAAGAHQGMWDMGIDIDLPFGSFKIYFQRLFCDNGARRLLTPRNKDNILGIYASLKNKWLQRIDLEWFNTEWQGGDGMPDPVGYDKNGTFMYVYKHEIPDDDPRGWLLEHFELSDIEAWESEQGTVTTSVSASKFLRWYWNSGEYSGRRCMLINGLYYQGWTVNGMCTGSALVHTNTTVDKYRNGEGTVRNANLIVNTRILAFNVAASGHITDELSYRFKYTFTRNHGSMTERYVAPNASSVLLEDYYFTNKRNEHYILLDLSYTLKHSILLNATLSTDFGELYNATGLRLGLAYIFAR